MEMEHPGRDPTNRHRVRGHPELRRGLVCQRRRQARRSPLNRSEPAYGHEYCSHGSSVLYCLLTRETRQQSHDRQDLRLGHCPAGPRAINERRIGVNQRRIGVKE